jgi:hypothetical protein
MKVTPSWNSWLTGEGSHIELTGLGPFLLPHISSVLDAQLDHAKNWIMVRAIDKNGTRLFLPFSDRAAASLATAQRETAHLWDREIQSISVSVQGMPQPVEMPLLADFVAFVKIEPDYYLLGFYGEAERRIMLSVSPDAYEYLSLLCNTLPAIRANPKK